MGAAAAAGAAVAAAAAATAAAAAGAGRIVQGHVGGGGYSRENREKGEGEMGERKLACAHVPVLPIIPYTASYCYIAKPPLLHSPFSLTRL